MPNSRCLEESLSSETAARAFAVSLLAHLNPDDDADSEATVSVGDLHLIDWIATSYDPASPAADMAEAHLRRVAHEHGLDERIPL